MIEIQKHNIGRYVVIRILGQIEKEDLFTLEERLRSTSSKNHPIAVFLEDSFHTPMFLLAPLIALRNSRTEPDATITIVNAPEEFRFIVQAAKLDHIFRFAPSLDSLKTD